ncbi:hypothetical protein [Corallococcus macrosporus]|uniref:Uncharacterized protein n=1 Tax=Myxococcus fulvus (strain ATCC BAA-855 / HW-1) TaxID=483219 RepID=F8CEH5_MYXFH|nr:hypothetical protein [Corallococcus macrosporus]AEI64845.1 hypothetical protein LILAB_14700 [Corallococcus macrosporus]
MPYLPLRCDWTHFAPSQETLAVTYDPPDAGRLVSVRLEVRDHANVLVYRSDALDCQGGPAAVAWTGALNVGNDAVQEPFATPLRAPYTLQVDAVIEPEAREGLRQPEDLPNTWLDPVMACEARRDQSLPEEEARALPPPPPTTARVDVLYHSVEVVRGPWLATGEALTRGTPASICHKLNQLGYYAGPPARAAAGTTDLLDKARERFRRNHGDLRSIAAATNANFEDALDGALGHAHGALPTLTDDQSAPIPEGTAIPQGNNDPLRVYVEAVGFDEDLANQTDEFLRQIPPNRSRGAINWSALHNKTASEAAKLNRPLVPLEAVIYLKGHDDRRVAAPRAVGEVRVDWSADEPGEDLSHLPLNDRVHTGTRTYVGRVLRSNHVDLHHDGGTNCPAAYGGIRTAANNFRNPFWREPQPYAPYAVPTEDAAAATIWVPAYTNDGAHPNRVGRAGVYLQPSLIAGDRYKVRARLSYQGRPNAMALEAANPVCQYETKPIVVWRRVEVFGVVGWPLRNHGALPAKCQARYAESFLQVDFSRTRYQAITAVLTHQDYVDWLAHIEVHATPVIGPLRAVLDATTLHDACPIVLRNPNAALSSGQKNNLYFFTNNMFSELVSAPNVPSAGGFLLDRIAQRMRTGHAPCGGIIMLEYKLSDDIKEALRTSDGGDVPTTSNGNGALMGIIDQDVNANADFVFTHEVGHCFWLTHHEAASGVVPQHHDQFDHNCMMSYPDWDGRRPQYPHQAPATFDPHFCGKCNLKLRGWDITHADILALDQPTFPDQLSALFYYDRADPGLRWDVELAHVQDAFTRVSRGLFRERFFDRNADFDTWMTDLGNCDIYHHVTHGNVRCAKHKVRVASMGTAVPRYPTWCRNDGAKVNRLTAEEQDLCTRTGFDPAPLTEWAKSSLITPKTYWHDLSSVIQWTVDLNDSSQDIEFTYEQLQQAFKQGRKAPRLLAFFSSCLLGWERRFAELFISRGTPYVIAFRSRYQTTQALPFSQRFYRVLRDNDFAPDAIQRAFMTAAGDHPHAEPCLFTAQGITRCSAATRGGQAAFQGCDWSSDAFDAPRFPNP